MEVKRRKNMYCENCGTQMNLGKFCPKCGYESHSHKAEEKAPQSAPVSPLPQYEPVNTMPQVQPFENNQQRIEKKPKKKKHKFILRAWNLPISFLGAFTLYIIGCVLVVAIVARNMSNDLGYIMWQNILIQLSLVLPFTIIPLIFYPISFLGLKKPLKMVSTPTLSVFYFMEYIATFIISTVFSLLSMWSNAGYIDVSVLTIVNFISVIMTYSFIPILGTVIVMMIFKKIEKYYKHCEEQNSLNIDSELYDETNSLQTESPVENKITKLRFRIWFVPVVIFIYEMVLKFAVNPFITNIFQKLSDNAALEGYDFAYCSSLITIGNMVYNLIYFTGIILSVIVFYLLAFINVKGPQRKACTGIKYIPLGAFGVIGMICGLVNTIVTNSTTYLPMDLPTQSLVKTSGDIIHIVVVFLVTVIATLVSYFILKGVEKIPESVEK